MQTAAANADAVPAPFHAGRRTVVALVSASIISAVVWALIVALNVR